MNWGRYPKSSKTHWLPSPHWYSERLPLPPSPQTLLIHGCGRSYGDSCLNNGESLLSLKNLDHLIAFDTKTGRLKAESGLTIDELLKVTVPQGWFVPVTPGTKFVTLGGAVANDVHGKNHHTVGSFGHQLLSIELERSTGERLVCSPTQNADLFRATIGGLGLTGAILTVELQLAPIVSARIQQEVIKFYSFKEFLSLSAEARDWPYVVAWIDLLKPHSGLCRGHLILGRHEVLSQDLEVHRAPRFTIPCSLPSWVLSYSTMRAFNSAYFHKALTTKTHRLVHYDPFFYPLDSIGSWNQIYGPQGFLQYQFVVPSVNILAVEKILTKIVSSGVRSFLGVMKQFGNKSPSGLLSFPREGITVALDFPMQGKALFDLLDDCDRMVVNAGGAIYPAKDARMRPEIFQQSYPQWKDFVTFKDPRFSSSFWRRVSL